jgi:fimbrial chaperone protein
MKAMLLAAFCALAVSGPVLAASLQVAPISLEFSPREQAQSVWLSNNGTAPLRAQVRVQQWTQADNADQLAPTRELVASPPVVEIAAGARQMVRIIRMQPAAPASEQSYRLIIDELPTAAGASPGTEPGGLQFLLRYSVPVFVGVTVPVPASSKPTDISGLSSTLQTSSQPPLLSITNSGAQRVRISQLVFVDAQGRRTPLVSGLVGYVLAGQRMQWPLNLPAAQALPSGGTLKAKFNADLEEQILPLANSRF